jgi:hypothetical protein
MSTKKFTDQDIQDTHGPMNSVSTEDSKNWAGDDGDDKATSRKAMAKKKKAVNSSKKNDRRISKQLIYNIKDIEK